MVLPSAKKDEDKEILCSNKLMFHCNMTITDIEFTQRLYWFRKLRTNVSKTILGNLNKHSWYIVAELTWTCIYPAKICKNEKQSIITKLKAWSQIGMRGQSNF